MLVSSGWTRWSAPKVLLVLACLTAWSGTARGQQQVSPQAGQLIRHEVVNFSELAAREARTAAQPSTQPPARSAIRFMRGPGPRPVPARARVPQAPAPVGLTAPLAQAASSPSPVVTFEAMSDNGTAIPPDTDGAVGPNHIVVALNEGVLIQQRNGTVISRVSLRTFWGDGFGVQVFDPRVLYDKFNDRWIMSAVCCPDAASSKVYVAVSATGDPTGVWNTYKVVADGTAKTWADYDTLGFTNTWITVSVNMFAITGVTGAPATAATIHAFSKADLYAGAASPFAVVFATASLGQADSGFTMFPAATHDNSVSTQYFVETWNGPAGVLRVSTLTGTPGSQTFTAGPVFPQASSTWSFNHVDAPQQGSTRKIDTGDDRILNVVYRNGSLWVAQNAFLPTATPTHAAAQWWQFLPSGTVQQFGRVDDSTETNFYAYPTIAVNKSNDVLLGFSCFSATTFASACYSMHAAGDAAGTMRSVVTYKAGLASYFIEDSSNLNRWGDYSSTVVDPVNDSDFWTIQEYAAAPNATSDVWGTWWAKVPAPVRRRVQVTSD